MFIGNTTLDEYIISLIFFSILVFSILVLFYKLKKGFSFEVGILFSMLFFIAPPSIFLLVNGVVELDLIGFGNTELKNVYLKELPFEVLLLSLYIFIISSWALMTKTERPKLIKSQHFQHNFIWRASLFLSVVIGLSLFIMTGMLSGGNWYKSGEQFIHSYGVLSTILMFLYASARIVFISYYFFHVVHEYKKKWVGMFLLVLYGVYETILTGNRIYLFVILSMIAIYILRNFKIKHLLLSLFLLPFGLILSMYTHIRGRIFEYGIPSLDHLIDLTSESLLKGNDLQVTILGAFESVNFNVIMSIFREVNLNNALWGETYAKILFFIVPRSIWEDKPLTITTQTMDLLTPGVDSLSLVATLIGEVHYNFWYIGLLLIVPLMQLTKHILFLYNKHQYGPLFFLNFCFGVLFFRMSYSDTMIQFLFSVLLIYILGQFKVMNTNRGLHNG